MNKKDFEGFLFLLECKLENIRSLVRSKSKVEHYIDELKQIVIKEYQNLKEK